MQAQTRKMTSCRRPTSTGRVCDVTTLVDMTALIFLHIENARPKRSYMGCFSWCLLMGPCARHRHHPARMARQVDEVPLKQMQDRDFSTSESSTGPNSPVPAPSSAPSSRVSSGGSGSSDMEENAQGGGTRTPTSGAEQAGEGRSTGSLAGGPGTPTRARRSETPAPRTPDPPNQHRQPVARRLSFSNC